MLPISENLHHSYRCTFTSTQVWYIPVCSRPPVNQVSGSIPLFVPESSHESYGQWCRSHKSTNTSVQACPWLPKPITRQSAGHPQEGQHHLLWVFPLFVKSWRVYAIKIQLEGLISMSATIEAGSQGGVSFQVLAGKSPLLQAADTASLNLHFENWVLDMLCPRSDSRAKVDTTQLPDGSLLGWGGTTLLLQQRLHYSNSLLGSLS